jgi:hypothetical protein
MQNISPALPQVPFTVPILGMTPEEYREYLSWRIQIQVLAMLLSDKSTPKSKIMDQLVTINHRANCFPVQPLPDDLRTTALEFTDPGGQPGILCMPLLIRRLWELFA